MACTSSAALQKGQNVYTTQSSHTSVPGNYYKRFIAIDSLLVTITRQTLKGIKLFTDDNLLYIPNDDQQILLFPKIKIIG